VLAGNRTPYEPEPFYNSAKFFDIEYQTYGQVAANVSNADCFLWRGADGRRFLRIVVEDGRVTGFNAFGLRLRSEVCLQWIKQGATLAEVLSSLRDANFDPEFFTTIREIQAVAI
jgi:hypothetical protein